MFEATLPQGSDMHLVLCLAMFQSTPLKGSDIKFTKKY